MSKSFNTYYKAKVTEPRDARSGVNQTGAGIMQDRRTKRLRTRSDQLRAAVATELEDSDIESYWDMDY